MNVSTVSMSKTVLFEIIHFSICTQFKYQNSSISSTQFSSIWLQARVNLGVIAMKGYSAFSKAPALLELAQSAGGVE